MVPFSYFHELIQTILASFHCVQSIICSIFLKYINITFYHFDYSHNWPYPNIGVGVVASMSSACWNLLQGTRVESSLDLLGPLSKGLTWNRFRSALACEIEIQIGHALTNTDAAIKWSFYIFREEHEQEYIGRGEVSILSYAAGTVYVERSAWMKSYVKRNINGRQKWPVSSPYSVIKTSWTHTKHFATHLIEKSKVAIQR